MTKSMAFPILRTIRSIRPATRASWSLSGRLIGRSEGRTGFRAAGLDGVANGSSIVAKTPPARTALLCGHIVTSRKLRGPARTVIAVRLQRGHRRFGEERRGCAAVRIGCGGDLQSESRAGPAAQGTQDPRQLLMPGATPIGFDH